MNYSELNRLIGAQRCLEHIQGDQMVDWHADENWPILFREMLHDGEREILISECADGQIRIDPDVHTDWDGISSQSFFAPCLGAAICQAWAKWKGII